jgi:hypothetical protein
MRKYSTHIEQHKQTAQPPSPLGPEVGIAECPASVAGKTDTYVHMIMRRGKEDEQRV